ncbi:MAG: RnfH family protein [Pseudomonadota bacterium]
MTDCSAVAVEVAYALPEKQQIVGLTVSDGTTAREAVLQSGLERQFPGLDLANAKLGIFGKAIKDSQVLKTGDRVEVYRPLIADPKEVRKRRAAEARSRREGD